MPNTSVSFNTRCNSRAKYSCYLHVLSADSAHVLSAVDRARTRAKPCGAA